MVARIGEILCGNAAPMPICTDGDILHTGKEVSILVT